jgi:hypothetical protein
MAALNETLKTIRQQMGFASARSFFNHLTERSQLDVNYSYYMRIERGEVQPSARTMQSLVAALPSKEADQIVLSYCENLFPSHGHLFKDHEKKSAEDLLPPPTPNLTVQSEQTLSERQVAAIAKSLTTYALFFIVTLARKPLTIKELEKSFSKEDLKEGLEVLSKAKTIFVEKSLVYNISTEASFPSADTDSLKRLYKRLDTYDRDLSEYYGFEKLTHRFLIRRISPRYLPIIINQSEVLGDLIKASDETDIDKNSEVLYYSLDITRGQLPG